MELSSPPRRVQRVRHELKRREVQVVAVRPLGPGFISVDFANASLADFASLSFDDHVKFMFTDSDGETVRRDYTPRAFDPARCALTIEFALHGDGRASTWARQATIGQHAVIGGPRASMVIPDDLRWQLLVGDATALPAIARRLAELPAGAPVTVVAQAADVADQRHFATAAALELHWVRTADALPAAVAALQLPPSAGQDGFAWAAGEAAAMARVRAVLAEQKGLAKEVMRVSAYWKRGASDYHEDL